MFGNVFVKKAKVIEGGLQCQIPTSQEFNSFVMEEKRDEVQLDVKFAGTTILTNRIPLLNCGKENSCHRYYICMYLLYS